MARRGGIELIADTLGLRHSRRRNHLIRPHKNHPALADPSPPDMRYTDDFVFWFEVKKLHERFWNALTPNDMHPGFHQQFDGGCTFPGEPFTRKCERAL